MKKTPPQLNRSLSAVQRTSKPEFRVHPAASEVLQRRHPRRSTTRPILSIPHANDLNQYQVMVHEGEVRVLGAANATAIVTVTCTVPAGTPAIYPTERDGERFLAMFPVVNAAADPINDAPIDLDIAVNIVQPGAGANNTDLLAVMSGTLTIATSENNFIYSPKGGVATDNRFDYAWDARDRLQEVSPVAPVDGDIKYAYQYDYQGRRAIRKTYAYDSTRTGNEWGDDATQIGLEETRYYIYAPKSFLLLAEVIDNGTGGVTLDRTYAYGPDLSGSLDGAGGVRGLLAITDHSHSPLAPVTYAPAYDGNGNVTAYVRLNGDGSGNPTAWVAATFEYEPFGKPVAEWYVDDVARSALDSAPRFATKLFDNDTGLYYFGYRHYDPETGRFLCRDPLREQGGLNLYAYCQNDPINKFDPLGLAGYFFGGTGNSLEKNVSNVEILYQTWLNAGQGLAFYMPGVYSGKAPTGEDYRLWNLRIIKKTAEGAAGRTLGARVDKMLEALETQLRAGDNTVNVFGFSRGATSALEFLNRIQDKIADKHPLYKDIEINFVAVWDVVKSTAASYRTELPPNMKFKHQPLHFIAIDEQRSQFFNEEDLNLQGAMQIGYRGKHADVGNVRSYPNAFGMWSLLDCYRAGRMAGLDFDYSELVKRGRWSSATRKPSDNDKIIYNDGEPRKFPADMILSESLRFYDHIRPYNDVSGHRTMRKDDWKSWFMKSYEKWYAR